MAVPASRYIFAHLSWYGLLIIIGASFAVYIASREEKRACLPSETIIDLAIRILPAGILGARLYYVVFSLDAFRLDPLSFFRIWEGGLGIYGGLIAGGLTVLLFCKRRNLPVFTVLDVIVPGVALAQAIGRWGNYFNQEAFGIAITNPIICFFPLCVQINHHGTLVWHLATFFLESVLDFFIFCFLCWGRRKRFRRKGDVFLTYALLYGAGRLLVENFRTDSLYLGRSIRISQLISVVLCILIVTIFMHRRFRQQRNSLSLFQWFLVLLFWGYGIASLFYCTGFLLRNNASISLQFYFLLVFSSLSFLTFLVLYGKSDPAEVCYANH